MMPAKATFSTFCFIYSKVVMMSKNTLYSKIYDFMFKVASRGIVHFPQSGLPKRRFGKSKLTSKLPSPAVVNRKPESIKYYVRIQETLLTCENFKRPISVKFSAKVIFKCSPSLMQEEKGRILHIFCRMICPFPRKPVMVNMYMLGEERVRWR
jgi:hypothetical protein